MVRSRERFVTEELYLINCFKNRKNGGEVVKVMKYSAMIVCILAVFMVMISAPVRAEEHPITVTGKVLVAGSNLKDAKSHALQEAYRQAAISGLGVWTSSHTEYNRNAGVDDEILANAEGYVLKYDVLNEGKDGNFYFVTIKARVDIDAIGADFKRIVTTLKGQMNHPKISFVLTTWVKDGQKLPDSTITTAFKQEFREKGFDLKATDKADEMAMSPYVDSYAIRDRRVIRDMATNEGANFVARGEAKILDAAYDGSLYRVAVQVEVEVIDVNSGENIATYTNTFSAINASEGEAQYNAIKKAGVEASRHLADQTIEKWQERTQTGKTYTIELTNITDNETQKLPFIRIVKSIANEINSQYSPAPGVLDLDILYGGSKDELEATILAGLRNHSGFSSGELDGPEDQNGKIVYQLR